MPRLQAMLLMAALVLSMCSCTGEQPTCTSCSPESHPSSPETMPAPAVTENIPIPRKVVELAAPKEVPPNGIPEVKMSEKDRATCKAYVGDMFPGYEEMKLPEGKKLGVVAFFPAGMKPIVRMKNEELIADLEKLAAMHGDFLTVSAIQVGGESPAENAKGVTILTDPERKRFGAVATQAEPPRLFVYDATGKILWLDIEYSNATRDQLTQCVEFILTQ